MKHEENLAGWYVPNLVVFFPSCAAHVLQCLRVCGCTSCCVVECETVGEGRPRDFNRSEILRLKFVKLKFQDYLILRIFTIYWPFFKSGLASHFLSPWCPWLPGGLCWCFGILWGLSPLIPNKVTPCHTTKVGWFLNQTFSVCGFWCFLMFFGVHPVKSCAIPEGVIPWSLPGSRRERQLLDDALQCLAMGGRYADFFEFLMAWCMWP